MKNFILTNEFRISDAWIDLGLGEILRSVLDMVRSSSMR